MQNYDLENVWLWYSLLLNFYILILVPYFVVQLGTELCTGAEIIETLEECKAAITQLDLYFERTQSTVNDPKGCYRYKETKYVLWNAHSSGKESSKGHPICKKGE